MEYKPRTYDPATFISILQDKVGAVSEYFPCKVREEEQCPDQAMEKPNCGACPNAWTDGIIFSQALQEADIVFLFPSHKEYPDILTQTHSGRTGRGIVTLKYDGRDAPKVINFSRRNS